MSAAPPPTDDATDDLLRRWAQTWDRAQVALDAVRRAEGWPGPRELEELLAINELLPPLERESSGLVEQQRLFRPLRR